MSLKISELPLSGTVSGTELVPIVQDGETRQITLSEISPVVPSTAKFYLPDLSTIASAIIDINSIYGPTGTATYSEDSLWSTFTSSNVYNGSPENPSDFYIGGFYNESEYVSFGNDVLNIAYTGNFNFGPNDPNPSYEAGSFTLLASIDTGTYDILNYVKLSFKGDVSVNYEWTDESNLGETYDVSGNFTNLQSGTILTFVIGIDIPQDTVSWSIGLLP